MKSLSPKSRSWMTRLFFPISPWGRRGASSLWWVVILVWPRTGPQGGLKHSLLLLAAGVFGWNLSSFFSSHKNNMEVPISYWSLFHIKNQWNQVHFRVLRLAKTQLYWSLKKGLCEFTERVNYTEERLQLVPDKLLLNCSKSLHASSRAAWSADVEWEAFWEVQSRAGAVPARAGKCLQGFGRAASLNRVSSAVLIRAAGSLPSLLRAWHITESWHCHSSSSDLWFLIEGALKFCVHVVVLGWVLWLLEG